MAHSVYHTLRLQSIDLDSWLKKAIDDARGNYEYLEAEADRLMHLVEQAEERGDPTYDTLSERWSKIEMLLSEVQR